MIHRDRSSWTTILPTLGLLSLMGCRVEAPATSAVTASNSAAVKPAVEDAGPSVVELQKVDAFIDADDILRLEVFYKFTSGAPTKHYMCSVKFPNSERTMTKYMTAAELTKEGSFKTAIEAGEMPPQVFELVLGEAESPDQGFDDISNTVTGPVRPKLETK